MDSDQALLLDRESLRAIFDLRTRTVHGEFYDGDPYPAFHRLRASGPVHPGVVHQLTGWTGQATWDGLPEPDRAHFSAFSYASCDRILRDDDTFRSSAVEIRGDEGIGIQSSMLRMGGKVHRRYRTLVQPSFIPVRAKWWIDRWIGKTANALIDGFPSDRRADLNVDFAAAIPTLTITGSFGVPVADALDIRREISRGLQSNHIEALDRYLTPIIAARRAWPEDDPISVLCQAEVSDEDGTHRLTDDEIFSFSYLLLAAGSGTTWKQLGITLAALLTHPDILARVREDRGLLRAAIDESLRWNTNVPTFARYAWQDVDLCGVHIPAGSVVHACLGAANRDPARWANPDAYDIDRPPIPSLAFGSGPHVCLGIHLARATIFTAVSALLDRCAGLRLDPDAEPPRIVGMYERGVTELGVVWDHTGGGSPPALEQ
jgi:cytochrome P450